MIYKAPVYPNAVANPTLTYSDASRPNLAICFSGGGSRALTCAWGQLLGLSSLGLLEQARYISSVSGGTWALSVYSFLPASITDQQLLGQYYPPDQLSLQDAANKFNINTLGEYALGKAPASFSLEELVFEVLLFLLVNQDQDHKWLWANVVAKHILEPFELREQGAQPWLSSYSYSLSKECAQQSWPLPAPALDQMHYLRAGRPFIVMNANLMQSVVNQAGGENIVQLPLQATAIATGSKGQTPHAEIVGGGMVESYGYASTLTQVNAGTSPVVISVAQPYSLIDIVSTSSAFFADAMLELLQHELSSSERRKALISRAAQSLADEHVAHVFSWAKAAKLGLTVLEEVVESYVLKLVDDLLKDKARIVPSYNYWPISSDSQNTMMPFTDGGTLDNTGILGILAQTDGSQEQQAVLHLLAFDNTATPLQKSADTIIAGTQAAPLFGVYYDEKTNSYRPFTQAERDPTSSQFIATSLIQVFDNTAVNGVTPFEQLQHSLFETNYVDGVTPLNAAFATLQLVTIRNTLANIAAGRQVKLLYAQNSQMNQWQNAIGDASLRQAIEYGQRADDTIEEFEDFAHFPYYNTIYKIGLSAKESNALSQMWAWAVADGQSPFSKALQDFFEMP